MNVLAEEQAGFRKGLSTTYHIYSLKCLIDLYFYFFRSKKLFCASVDNKKALVMFSCVFVTFLFGVLGQLWYPIVSDSIPDLCLLPSFDSVNRTYIWQKLLNNNNIESKMFKIIFKLYANCQTFGEDWEFKICTIF